MNILANAISARQAGFNELQGFKDQRTRNMTGNVLATGDYGEAAATAYRGGDVDLGAKIEALSQTREDRTTAQAEKAETKNKEEMKQKAAALVQVSTAIKKRIPVDPNNPEASLQARQQALQQIAPWFKSVGIDPSAFTSLPPEQLTDQNIDLFTGQVNKELEQFTLGVDEVRHDSRGNVIARGPSSADRPHKPDWKERKNADGSTTWVDLASDEQADAPAGGISPQGGGGFDAHIDPLLKREGGYVARDGRSAAPANFGINQKYNPDVDVANLTPEKAKEIYKSRYWDVIQGDSLPPQAQAAVFDAAVNQGPQRALNWWREAGGDLQRFNELRLEHYRSRPDYEQNKASWEGRVAETGGGALTGGGGSDNLGSSRERPGSAAPAPRSSPPAQLGLSDLGNGYFQDKIGRTYQYDSVGKLVQTAGITDSAVAKATEKITGINSILGAVDEFDDAIKQMRPQDFGPNGKYLGDPQKYARAKAAATNLQMLVKNESFFNLGVITGPDLGILEGVIPDISKIDTAIRKGQIQPALKQLSTSLGQKYASEMAAFQTLGGRREGMPDIYRSPRGKFARGGRPPPGGGAQKINVGGVTVTVKPKG